MLINAVAIIVALERKGKPRLKLFSIIKSKIEAEEAEKAIMTKVLKPAECLLLDLSHLVCLLYVFFEAECLLLDLSQPRAKESTRERASRIIKEGILISPSQWPTI